VRVCICRCGAEAFILSAGPEQLNLVIFMVWTASPPPSQLRNRRTRLTSSSRCSARLAPRRPHSTWARRTSTCRSSCARARTWCRRRSWRCSARRWGGVGSGLARGAGGVHGVGHLQALLDRACARSPRSRSPRSTPSVSVSSRQESPMPPALHLARPLAPLHGPRTGAGAIATPALSSSVAQDTSGSMRPQGQGAGTFTLPLPSRGRTSLFSSY